MRVARKWLHSGLEQAQAQVDKAVDSYVAAERRVTNTVADLKAENEDLLPGSIYVLVAGLAGAIFTRRRNILLRATVPLATGVAAFAYFLPTTYRNTRALVWQYEQRAPALADAHIQVDAQVRSAFQAAQNAAESAETALESGVHTVRSFVAESTGLRLPTDESKDSRKNK